MARYDHIAAFSGMIAALAMAASPASAAEIPHSAPIAGPAGAMPAAFDEGSLAAQRHHYWRYRRHGHVDGGDVLAGVLILGGIAAIASAANNSQQRERDVRYRDYRQDRYDYRDRRTTRRSNGGRGIEGAVDMCLGEIERDVRVDEVESVDRTGEGWRVTGTIFNGDRFTCDIDENGRIERVDYGGGFAAATPADGPQYSDERYRAAWAEVDSEDQPATAPEESVEQLPAYPGGPVDGDLEDDAGDGRYTMAQAPTG